MVLFLKMHAGDIASANPKTPDFSAHSEFLVKPPLENRSVSFGCIIDLLVGKLTIPKPLPTGRFSDTDLWQRPCLKLQQPPGMSR